MRWMAPELFPLLWLVPAAFALLLWASRARRRDEAALGEGEILRRRWGALGPSAYRLRAFLLLAALAAAILAMARPQAGLRLVTTTSTGPDVVIALDLSESMHARDARPDRLTAARREIASILQALQGSAIGLVGFAGDARVLSPLTTDLEGLRDRLEAATPEDLDSPGSNIGAGLSLAAQLLRRPGDRPRAVILLTDGEQLDGDPGAGLPPLRAARAALIVLGIGTPDGATIPLVDSTGAVRGTKSDATGAEVRTRLSEGSLRALARVAGGHYERAGGNGTAGRHAASLARGNPRGDAVGRTLQSYDERFHWLAAAAALLLAVDAMIPRRRPS